MTFPVVISRATGSLTTNASLHPITALAALNPPPQAGDMVVVAFSMDGNGVITVETGAGWRKIEPQAGSAASVAGAIFWKIWTTTTTLTLETRTVGSPSSPMNEQSSHIALCVRGAKLLEGISAVGSGASSDPPLLTPLGGLQDYLWFATRHGDASVVPTAAPGSPGAWTNLTNVVGGGQGATTTVAESAQAVSSMNPGTFTVNAEQWVCWTLAAYTWSVSRDLAPSYGLRGTVFNSLSPVYDIFVNRPEAWFARTTSTFHTWSTLLGTSVPIWNDLSPSWRIMNAVDATFTAAYRVGEALSGTSELWFPRLTTGWHTWAGETAAPSTGVIDGAALFPFAAIEVNLSVAYNVLRSVEQNRSVTYQVRAYVEADLAPAYTVNGVIDSDLFVEYDIAQPASAEFSAAWNVLGIVGSVWNELTPEYDITSWIIADLAPSWQILDVTTQPTVEREIEFTYAVRGAVEKDLVPTWNVLSATEVERDYVAQYGLRAAIEADLVSGWTIALDPVIVDLAPTYGVRGSVEDSFDVVWQVIGAPTRDLVVEYDVSGVTLAALQVNVYRYGQAEVSR